MQSKTTIGISQALYAIFGESVKRSEDTVEQDLEAPAFYILCINTEHKQRLGNHYRRSQSYDIHYFPKAEGEERAREMSEMTERLYRGLEFITVDEKMVRGLNMHAQVQEDVLHFFVDYDIALVKQINKQPCMEELDIKGGVRIVSKKE